MRNCGQIVPDVLVLERFSIEPSNHRALLRSMIGWQSWRHFFLNQWEAKQKPIVPWSHAFSRAWRRLHVFASSSDWLIVLFMFVVIGQSNNFGFGFTILE